MANKESFHAPTFLGKHAWRVLPFGAGSTVAIGIARGLWEYVTIIARAEGLWVYAAVALMVACVPIAFLAVAEWIINRPHRVERRLTAKLNDKLATGTKLRNKLKDAYLLTDTDIPEIRAWTQETFEILTEYAPRRAGWFNTLVLVPAVTLGKPDRPVTVMEEEAWMTERLGRLQAILNEAT